MQKSIFAFMVLILVVGNVMAEEILSSKLTFIPNKGQIQDTSIKYYVTYCDNLVFFKDNSISIVKRQQVELNNIKVIQTDLDLSSTANNNILPENPHRILYRYYDPLHPNGLNIDTVYTSLKYKNSLLNSEISFQIKDNRLYLQSSKKAHYSLDFTKFHKMIKNDSIIFEFNGINFLDQRVISKSNTIYSKDSIEVKELLWSRYFGGSGNDYLWMIKADKNGDIVTGGVTTSPDCQTSTDAYQKNMKGSSDIIISKIDSSGDIIWCTYYGGSSDDAPTAICFDKLNNICCVGETNSTDFPLSQTAPLLHYAGGTKDAFYIKLDKNGQLLFSSIIGGSEYDSFDDCVVDSKNNIWIIGRSCSGSICTTQNAKYKNSNGAYDAIICKFSENNQLLLSTFWGASSDDFGESIAVDGKDNIIITGFTSSEDYPVLHAAQNEIGGNSDAYITKFDNDFNMIWSTFYGGNNYDNGSDVACDTDDNIFIIGNTFSSDLPISIDASQKNIKGTSDYYILKVSEDGDFLKSTYWGSSADEGIVTLASQLSGIITDENGKVYITGTTSGNDFPATTDAYQPSLKGNSDAFLSVFDNDLNSIYSTYLGEGGNNYGIDLTIADSKYLYLVGRTDSKMFPVSNTSEGQMYSGGIDGFICKFGLEQPKEVSTCGNESFKFDSFTSNDSLLYTRDCTHSNNICDMNKVKVNSSGAIWYYKRVPVNKPFSTDFTFSFSEPNKGESTESSLIGADGLALVIQNSEAQPIGYDGGGLGYESIPNSVAFEIDVFANDSLQIEDKKDPNGNHIAVQSNLEDKSKGTSADHNNKYTIALNKDILPIISDGTPYYVKIDWGIDGHKLRMFIDTTGEFQSPSIIIDNFDISKYIDLIDGKAYIGITGATGSSYQRQEITEWAFCNYDTEICPSGSFDYSKFSSSNFQLNGSADTKNGSIKLTDASKRENGSAWYKEAVPIGEGFTVDYSFQLNYGSIGSCTDDGSLPGADGLAFVIQNAGTNSVGYTDWGLGYEGLKNSLAVEYDTFYNPTQGDVNGNHIAVQSGGQYANSSYHTSLYKLGINNDVLTMNPQGGIYYSRVEYSKTAKKLLVYFNDKPIYSGPVITINNIELDKLLSLTDNKYAYVGFTAGTGDSWEEHLIKSFRLCLSEPSMLTDVSANTNNDKLPSVYPNPSNGKTSINYLLRDDCNVEIDIYNNLGEKSESFNLGVQSLGHHKIEINTEKYQPGTYYYLIRTCQKTVSGRFVVAK